ncbi:MAG TPA: spore coat protein [Clostridia bacterium]|nr:spore coat protein [Clostridia bacterium]
MTNMADSMKAIKKQANDQTIGIDMLMAAKAAAGGYFMATLESPTPEMRAMFRSALNQTMDEYSTLMELAVNRNWLKPYGTVEQQLTEAYSQSGEVVSYHKE